MPSESKKYPRTNKKLAIGFVVEGWTVESLRELIDIISGGTPSTYVQEYWNGDINWFVPTEIDGRKYVLGSRKKITEKGLKNSSANLLPKGAILLTSRAGIGDLAILNIESCTNQGIQALIPKPKINGEYLYYLMLTKKSDLLSKASGSTFLEIRPDSIKDILVQRPPKKEQTAIAAVLSDTDKLIEKLEQLIAKKRAIKKGAMQQFLTGKKRFPGFSGEWKNKQIGKVAAMKSGGTPPTSNKNYYNGHIPWVTIADMSKASKFIHSTHKNISTAGLDNSTAQIYPAGVVLYAMYASIGECCIAGTSLSSHQAILAITPKKDLHNEFLFYYLTLIKNYAKGMAQHGTQGNLNKKLVSEINIHLPKIKEQTAIAAVLSDMDAEISALKESLKKYRQIKIGMMQQLLTGKIRLAPAEATLSKKPHNKHFNEAVILGVLADAYGKEEFPLGRLRRTKLMYFLHRKTDDDTSGYLKQAAGPYNPSVKYDGAEKIALKKGYVLSHMAEKRKGFIAHDNVTEAYNYFNKWYGKDALQWLEQFRYKTNKELELLSTVDMAAREIKKSDKIALVATVRSFIKSEPKWRNKLSHEIFSDKNIEKALRELEGVFDDE